MTDFIEVLSKIAPGKRARLSMRLFEERFRNPSPQFLQALGRELAGDGDPYRYESPAFFSIDTELDSIYCAAVAAAGGDWEGIYKDRGGLPELDGLRLDFVLAYRREGGAVELVIGCAKLSGRWANRRSRRLSDRLKRVFGESGDAFASITPRFVALSPERPGRSRISSWPRWMRRDDDSSYWIAYRRNDEELKVVRCEKSGRSRAFGRYWKLEPPKPTTRLS